MRFGAYVQRGPLDTPEQFMVDFQERPIVRYELKIRSTVEGESKDIIYDLDRVGFPYTPITEMLQELWVAYRTQSRLGVRIYGQYDNVLLIQSAQEYWEYLTNASIQTD